MICLRLWRSLLTGFTTGAATFGPRSLPCALLLGLLAVVASAAGAAATRSRARHLTPALTPLHYTERSFSTPRHARGSGKAAANRGGASGSTPRKARGAASGVHPATKHGGKRSRETDYEAPVPILRAGHGKPHAGEEVARIRPHLSRGNAQIAEGRLPRRRIPLPAPDPVNARGHSPLHAPRHAPVHEQDNVVAEVTGRSAEGDTLARLHGRQDKRPGSHAANADYGAGPVIVASAASSNIPAPVERRAPAPASLAQPMADYAYRTAHVDDPRAEITEVPGRDTPDREARAEERYKRPVSPVQAPAPVRRLVPGSPSTQVVDGFGSELALAPALASDHPGLTRRRGHSLAASALSEDSRSSAPAVLAASLPSTLAESDAVTAGAIAPTILSPQLSSQLSLNLPSLYDGDGRLVMPAPLRGSREILIHQNTMADSDGLERIQNDAELNRLRSTRQLVDLPASAALHLNEDLPLNRRTARPWTVLFTQDIARDFYARFHQPLWLTSAVRTVAFQSHLLRVNGNAAGLSGDFASPHLTGQAIDFGKHGMTAAQLAWMRSYLLPLIQSGKIDVEEEFQQACFHISVYRRYAGGRHLVTATIQASSQPAAYPQIRSMGSVPRSLPASGPVIPRIPNVLTNPELTDTDQ